MDWKKNSIDMSSFLLLEDSADSEVDCFASHSINPDRIAAAKDEDAESCSCDCEEHVTYEVFECRVEEEEKKEDGGGGGDEEDDDDDDDGCWESWRSCKMGLPNAGLAEEEEESKVIADMDDKLFWETCMAVGYP